MKMIPWVIGVVVCGMVPAAFAQGVLEVEGGYVMPGYMDVAIPGDTGTRFSLSDDLDAEALASFRVRYGYTFARKHWVAVLVAPLTVESHGTLYKDVDFNGTTFPEGTSVDSRFRFDSYRLLYRYLFHQSDRWRLGFGAAAKVRSAAIQLKGGGLESEKTNVGVVPLLSFNLAWTPNRKWTVLLDGEALAAPQGRAEDLLLAVRYDVNQRLAVQAGYRILEGGSDADDVYTFSLFHSAVAGVVWKF